MFTKEVLIQVILAIVIIYVLLKYLVPMLGNPAGAVVLLLIGVAAVIWVIRAFF